MTPDELEGAIAMQANAIVGEACREAFRWAANRLLRGVRYWPPLLRGDLDVEENEIAEQRRIAEHRRPRR